MSVLPRLQSAIPSSVRCVGSEDHEELVQGGTAMAAKILVNAEAKDEAPAIVGWILNQIGILYGWEEDLRNSRAGPGFGGSIRASHSRMVVERLGRALQKLQPRYLPHSPMGEAISFSYALNQWEAVSRLVHHREVELDDKMVENAIRPTCVGKRNWMFFGSEEAGVRNAAVFTLIQNCRMHGVEPYAYLKDVLERLPTTTSKQVAELTPLKWKLARVARQACRQTISAPQAA